MMQDNRIPEAWIRTGYDTAQQSLSLYLDDFISRLKYWSDFKLPVVQISMFFNPTQFLTAFLQKYSRENNVPITQIQNKLSVMSYFETQDIPANEMERIIRANQILLTGLYLEGADFKHGLLVDSTSVQQFNKFPLILVQAVPNSYEDEFKDSLQ
jgi:hypothetical protein